MGNDRQVRNLGHAALAGALFATGLVFACTQENPAPGTGSGSSGSIAVTGGSTGAIPSDASFDACTATEHRQETKRGPLDLYFILDRSRSMLDDGRDCDYVHGEKPGEASKACYATYALNDYLIDTPPAADTRFAFQFMTLRANDCDGEPYATPAFPLQKLPLSPTDPLIATISDEDFASGPLGTHIEGALRGLIQFTSKPENLTAAREMIGVLMTDGEPNGCEDDIPTLAKLIGDHHTTTGTKIFVIGMEGAIDQDLETLAIAGGAEPHDEYCGEVAAPCHYWNVEDGSDQEALATALQAIIAQSAPVPCEFPVLELEAPEGEQIDFTKVNLTLNQGGASTTIGWVPDAASCPAGVVAWYYDNPTTPTKIHLCPSACDTVSVDQSGASISVVMGCNETTVVQ